MTSKKNDEQTRDEMAEKRSHYDHETSTLMEPAKGDDPQVRRHQVDMLRDPALFEEESKDAPAPRRGDPFAHQRDEKAAKAEHKKEAAKDEDKSKDDKSKK